MELFALDDGDVKTCGFHKNGLAMVIHSAQNAGCQC